MAHRHSTISYGRVSFLQTKFSPCYEDEEVERLGRVLHCAVFRLFLIGSVYLVPANHGLFKRLSGSCLNVRQTIWKTVIKFSSCVHNSQSQFPLFFQLLMYHNYTNSFVTAQIRIRVGSELVTSDSKRIQLNTIYRSITGHIFRRRDHTQDRMGSRPKNDVVSIVHHMDFAILWRVQRKICAITAIPISVFHFHGTQHLGSLQSILNWTSTHPRWGTPSPTARTRLLSTLSW